MASATIISQLQVLRRQYFQLVEPRQLRWLEDAALKSPHAQAWMFAEMFDASRVRSPPPGRYQLRVLKQLIAKLERAIEDPEEDVRHPTPRHTLTARLHLIERARMSRQGTCRCQT